ncbi:MAG: calcineurin-like phosphoesterase family protein [Bacteroidales bacterium]|jgi:predicted MPP superfamily phosphohydrolase|nr:calcineurin-like phosphoesterase family protein [Bacteroidales bacterium]MDD3333240.1 calcineurin-like phosphoesterase family protein [Proteiniphilum sp.]MDD3555061.1 calcineurin-like phosphoesterase family protein [Proteiniphilum sp.]MDD5620522.1 calcineurin-like phosphoesterase family protein [Proteiniphilum sp.]MDY0181675.1 calcineurin-like phosphoesterase family protein [Proteiniphilum sp.]
MKYLTKYLLLFSLLLQFAACSSKEEDPINEFDVQFELPALIDIAKGGEHLFKVKEGRSPLTTDQFILESDAGISFVSPIIKSSSESFTIRLGSDLKSGYHNVYIRRDTRKKLFGKTYLNIVDDIGFVPDEGTTIYGIVSTGDGSPVENVVVSDGVEVTLTNEEGIYQLKSAKRQGFVFISIPGGYEVSSKGVLPQFFYTLKGAPNVVERVDFSLKRVPNQDDYKVFMLGDMHLANRTSDLKQFAEFTTDLNSYREQHSGEKMYAIALGDMTWELYWYKNSYAFPEYLNTVNTQLKDLQIFHVIGNHDNDYKGTSDFSAEIQFRNLIAPTYYSFNIGKVHYVVIDNIDCSNYDGSESRNYQKSITSEQLNWLAKDLSHVNKSTPVVVATHAQIFYPTTSGFKYDHDVTNTTALFNVLAGYEVHFVTGHTHQMFNVTPESAITGNHNFYEHNSGAVCASWWWSGHLTPGVHISPDGTPGGYAIWDVTGTSLKWKYKATGWPEEYQFRSYDLNNVHFSSADVPLMPSNLPDATKKVYQQYVDAYPATNNNEVLINIWNWSSNWTLSVVDEEGNNLTHEKVWAYDPLHIAALSVKRFNQSNLTSTPSFVTNKFTHFFKVKANNAEADLRITVKDEFGNSWTEEMERPKPFSIEEYKR